MSNIQNNGTEIHIKSNGKANVTNSEVYITSGDAVRVYTDHKNNKFSIGMVVQAYIDNTYDVVTLDDHTFSYSQRIKYDDIEKIDKQIFNEACRKINIDLKNKKIDIPTESYTLTSFDHVREYIKNVNNYKLRVFDTVNEPKIELLTLSISDILNYEKMKLDFILSRTELYHIMRKIESELAPDVLLLKDPVIEDEFYLASLKDNEMFSFDESDPDDPESYSKYWLELLKPYTDFVKVNNPFDDSLYPDKLNAFLDIHDISHNFEILNKDDMKYIRFDRFFEKIKKLMKNESFVEDFTETELENCVKELCKSKVWINGGYKFLDFQIPQSLDFKKIIILKTKD